MFYKFFPIVVRFVGVFSLKQREAFEIAAGYWSLVLGANVPLAHTDIGLVDGLVIDVGSIGFGEQVENPIVGATEIRSGSLIPARGVIMFHARHLACMEARGILVGIAVREIGNVLSLGALRVMNQFCTRDGENCPVSWGGNEEMFDAEALGPLKPNRCGGRTLRRASVVRVVGSVSTFLTTMLVGLGYQVAAQGSTDSRCPFQRLTQALVSNVQGCVYDVREPSTSVVDTEVPESSGLVNPSVQFM